MSILWPPHESTKWVYFGLPMNLLNEYTLASPIYLYTCNSNLVWVSDSFSYFSRIWYVWIYFFRQILKMILNKMVPFSTFDSEETENSKLHVVC